MTDSPESSRPGSHDLEALVQRALAERVDPISARLRAIESSLARLGEAGEIQADDLRSNLATAVQQAVAQIDHARAAETTLLLGRIAALEVPLQRDAEERRSAGRLLRESVVTTVEEAMAHAEVNRATDTGRIIGHLDALRHDAQDRQAEAEELVRTVSTAIEQGLVWLEGAVTTDAGRILEQITALEAPLTRSTDARQAQADDLRTSIVTTLEMALARIEATRAADASSLERAVAQIEATHAADAARLHEQVSTVAEALATDAGGRRDQAEDLRGAVGAQLEETLGEIERARTADAARVLDRVAALEGPLTRDAGSRQAQLDDLRAGLAATIEQAVSRIESGATADAARVLEQVAAVAARAETDAHRREEQARALLAAVDERLEALHAAGTGDGDAREERLSVRLEAVSEAQRQALLDRIDERTAPVAELAGIPDRVTAEVHGATAAALTGQVEPLIARLVEAVDALAHEGGRIEALARGHAGEARVVEERVAVMFAEVADRAEGAVDRSRVRISEGQVALGARLDSVSGALLEAVRRSTGQLAEALVEIRATVSAVTAERAAARPDSDRSTEVLAQRLDGLQALVESLRSDPRLAALVVEQVAARDAQLAAISSVSSRIDQVGPMLARALLAEVQRAANAASAAEDAVASLRPDALREAIGEAVQRAADEVRQATRRVDENLALIADQLGRGLAELADTQAALRRELAELPRPTEEAAVARLEEMDRSLAGALTGLAAAVDASRDRVLGLAAHALDRSAAVADELAQAGELAIDGLRESQTTLREAVQDGAHKSELAVLDIRGLRDRLAPHLEALAEATIRRAEADQAGFDAVLARLDQLLAARPPG